MFVARRGGSLLHPVLGLKPHQYVDRIFGKIAVFHPTEETGLPFENLTTLAAFELAEIEIFLSVILSDYSSGKIQIASVGTEFRKIFDVILQVIVSFELTEKDLICSLGIRSGRVRVFQILSTIELIRGHESALFHFVEDILDIYQAAITQIEANPCASELLYKHRDIELVAVVPGDIASAEKIIERTGDLTECRLFGHILIRDMMNRGALGRDRHLRINSSAFSDRLTLRENLY